MDKMEVEEEKNILWSNKKRRSLLYRFWQDIKRAFAVFR